MFLLETTGHHVFQVSDGGCLLSEQLINDLTVNSYKQLWTFFFFMLCSFFFFSGNTSKIQFLPCWDNQSFFTRDTTVLDERGCSSRTVVLAECLCWFRSSCHCLGRDFIQIIWLISSNQFNQNLVKNWMNCGKNSQNHYAKMPKS